MEGPFHKHLKLDKDAASEDDNAKTQTHPRYRQHVVVEGRRHGGGEVSFSNLEGQSEGGQSQSTNLLTKF